MQIFKWVFTCWKFEMINFIVLIQRWMHYLNEYVWQLASEYVLICQNSMLIWWINLLKMYTYSFEKIHTYLILGVHKAMAPSLFGEGGGELTLWWLGGHKFESHYLFVLGSRYSLIFPYSQTLICVVELVDLREVLF